ncbi:MAG: MerR family transcriptional regulator [Nitrospirota bacterium]|nr:MAG: MerR family transcriptional regulator [Nitrospirota bacterium]
MGALTIGKLARKADVNIETIRYYERRGLMPNPRRTESGYRQYREDEVSRLRFIKNAKELGFSLKEIDELLTLRLDQRTPSSEVKKRAEEKIEDIENKIRKLRRIKKRLTTISDTCDGHGAISDCPILEALDK